MTTMDLKEYKFPKVSDMQVSVGGGNTIPELLEEAKKRGFYEGDTPFNRLFDDLFFKGGVMNYKKNLDETFKINAVRYLASYMRSFEPSHEDKEAVSALILSELVEVQYGA